MHVIDLKQKQAWPSGPRCYVQVVVCSHAWVRVPPLAFLLFCFSTLFLSCYPCGYLMNDKKVVAEYILNIVVWIEIVIELWWCFLWKYMQYVCPKKDSRMYISLFVLHMELICNYIVFIAKGKDPRAVITIYIINTRFQQLLLVLSTYWLSLEWEGCHGTNTPKIKLVIYK